MVSDYLSFRRAAVALGVQQSVVSRRIALLEDQLGVSLFERNTGGCASRRPIVNAVIRCAHTREDARVREPLKMTFARLLRLSRILRLIPAAKRALLVWCGRPVRRCARGKDVTVP
jgi:hypothetical protein